MAKILFLHTLTVRAALKGVAMRTAKIFPDGQSQTVRLPGEFQFECEYVLIRRKGKAIFLQPPASSWDTLLDSAVHSRFYGAQGSAASAGEGRILRIEFGARLETVFTGEILFSGAENE